MGRQSPIYFYQSRQFFSSCAEIWARTQRLSNHSIWPLFPATGPFLVPMGTLFSVSRDDAKNVNASEAMIGAGDFAHLFLPIWWTSHRGESIAVLNVLFWVKITIKGDNFGRKVRGGGSWPQWPHLFLRLWVENVIWQAWPLCPNPHPIANPPRLFQGYLKHVRSRFFFNLNKAKNFSK